MSRTLASPSPAKRRWFARTGFRRVASSAFGLLLLALVVHLLTPHMASIEQSMLVLRSFVWWLVVLAIAMQILSYVGNGAVTRAIVLLFGVRLPIALCAGTAMAAYSLSLLGGGQVASGSATYRWIHAAGAPEEAAILAGIVPAVVNMFTVGAAGTFGLAYLLMVHRLSRPLAVVFGISLAILVAIALLVWWGWQGRDTLLRPINRVGAVVARLRHRQYDGAAVRATVARIYGALDLLRAGGWSGPLIGDVVNVGCDLATLYLIFLAAHYTVNPGLVLAGYGLPLLAGKISFLPGGLGAVEGGMLALYVALGVPRPLTLVVILAYRLVSFWLPVLLGFALIAILDRWSRVRPVAAAAVPG